MAGEPFSAAGYLANAPAASPLTDFFAWAASTPWPLEFTNVMIPVGEFLIGLGLIVGALIRLAALFGGLLMVFFYLGNADWAHGYVNGDLMGLMLFVTVGVFAAGRIARGRVPRRHSWRTVLRSGTCSDSPGGHSSALFAVDAVGP